MENIWWTAAVWLALALLAAFLGSWLRVSVALTEILVGILSQLLMGVFGHASLPGVRDGWVAFLAGTGSVVLTFLAGAELDPDAFRRRWKEATVMGLAGFLAPFLGAAWAARQVLGWAPQASWLAGVALSTTSVAVVLRLYGGDTYAEIAEIMDCSEGTVKATMFAALRKLRVVLGSLVEG